MAQEPQPVPDRLLNLLVRRKIEADAPPQKYILFLDMLGFANLTEAHPDRFIWEFDDDDDIITSGTSESANQLVQFQHVLNTTAADEIDGTSPSHLMLFSDCAFLVYESASKAAISATGLMRRFWHQAVPVRMGLAFGTWHPERFSFDAYGSMTVTRAVFYGTGVVRATKAEKGGKGFRIFTHSTIAADDLHLVSAHVAVLPTPEAHSHAPFELNYLHTADGRNLLAADKDKLFQDRFLLMRARLKPPIEPDVMLHYTATLDALNRMRKQLGRNEFPPPILPII